MALTLANSRQFVCVGASVDYIIAPTNPIRPCTVTAMVTDALPPQLSGGSWTCVGFGGVVCASGSGNTLSDTVTLPVGSQASYIYSATVTATSANDQIVNTASVALTSGADLVPGNNTASDTDIVAIFRDGFDGTTLMQPTAVGDGNDFVTATLRIDATLLAALSIAPTPIASGRAADGSERFTLELARLGSQIALRTLKTDRPGTIERPPWQTINLDQRLLSFAWQPAADRSNVYLTVNGDAAFMLGTRVATPLSQLWVTVENNVPWLVALSH